VVPQDEHPLHPEHPQPQEDPPCFFVLIIERIMPATIKISTAKTTIVPIFSVNHEIISVTFF
jgi:hypothetical protein